MPFLRYSGAKAFLAVPNQRPLARVAQKPKDFRNVSKLPLAGRTRRSPRLNKPDEHGRARAVTAAIATIDAQGVGALRVLRSLLCR